MKPTWEEVFTKLYELYCESDQADEVNYFKAFDNVLEMPLARFRYEQLEEELGKLDDVAWQEFKQKVLTYVTTKDSRRGYNQLFECFNEVKGFLYLKTDLVAPKGQKKTSKLSNFETLLRRRTLFQVHSNVTR